MVAKVVSRSKVSTTIPHAGSGSSELHSLTDFWVGKAEVACVTLQQIYSCKFRLETTRFDRLAASDQQTNRLTDIDQFITDALVLHLAGMQTIQSYQSLSCPCMSRDR